MRRESASQERHIPDVIDDTYTSATAAIVSGSHFQHVCKKST